MRAIFSLLACAAVLAATARADLVFYQIPNTQSVVTLQGEATINPGRTVSFRHNKFGVLTLGMEDTRIHKVPTTDVVFSRMMGQAIATRKADEVVKTARYALKHGMLNQFNAAIDKALEFDEFNKPARRIKYLRELTSKDLGDSDYEELKLRKLVGRDDMKVAKSKHFILLHDTPDKPSGNRRKPRAQERLDLLEMVYESFLNKFYLDNVKLDVPQERLMVVLFAQERDYFRFIETLDPSLRSASGFWVPVFNVSVFFDQGSGKSFNALKELAVRLDSTKKEALRIKASNAKDIVRVANTIGLLVEMAQEDQDIEVVSHEATHQMAGSTGLFPRDVNIPVWVHEGLATYFESPKDATWAGIGAVNEERLRWYRGLQHDREHSNIDFIAQDKIFKMAGSHESRLHGYGQAWALTHFLMERHFDKLVVFYRSIGKHPADEPLEAEEIAKLFAAAFGKNYKKMDGEWRSYMDSLKTDVEVILEVEEKKGK